ncbi:Mitochondrial transcription termination factor family protein [Quillaja saponaria]|uniref:Mitochondrial transcription termination factor family protein n=1 Tax=Quillaja saponaria TaxID=32244 RepID=A0AAD7Q128_QUISA|nr:Mitochondrial transcription termination factor family protein [Quillaja saponaria]
MEAIRSLALDYRTISSLLPSRKSSVAKKNIGDTKTQPFPSLRNQAPHRQISCKISAKESNFTLSYLINSCGLAPETAILASQKVNLQSPDRPDTVLTLLRNYGFSRTQISNVVRKRPLLLLANPKDTLLPKLEFFQSIGVSNADLARTLTADPTLLTRSLEKQIIPSYTFLKSVPESCVALLLTHFPEALMQKKDQFSEIVVEVKEMGFDPTKSTFVLAIHAISGEGNKAIWNRCYEVYQRWGWSEDDILLAFRKHPHCMILSESKIMKAMDFFVNKMGWPSGMIARCPVVLFFSLEKRIKPRCLVVKVLSLKGLIKKTLSLTTVLLPVEKLFLEKFVIKYEEDVPQLLSVYHGKLDIQSVI